MGLKDDLVAYLKGKTAITDIVGTGVEKIRQGWAQQGIARPYITLDIANHNHEHDLGGSAGFKEPTVEINLWTSKQSDRDSLGEAVRGVLQGFRGTMNSGTVTKCTTLENDNEFDEPDRHSGEGVVYRRVMEFKFSVTETIPSYA